ncbi:TetR/AcrR family transcriptional regulator [Nocardioides sp. B-3]|uniref:TetR/AcrR family transcriptional regulator n=1 Tax=Nocardioides sp. B-3 TaxID=2895565 RepID=UPI00215299A7|nr:TetR/AcrR family transcriptional regulator [Nocardioides sp. B-3]UUZ61537.1 TetR/AcrR family transcriptional regulator [Nocardioides sp. B-3]
MSQIKSSRREKAAATRRTIVRAAHAEFVEQGFHGATVTAIAKRAGVAPQTVYFVFSNKSALISAAIDTAVMGEDAPTEPQLMPWFGAMLAEPDAAESLRIFVRGSADIFAGAAGLAEVLRAAALTDEEVRRTHLSHERLREEGFRRVVDMLAGKGPLCDGLTPKAATDVLLTVLGDSTYHLLTTERGWSHEQVVNWWTDTLPRLLLAG